MQISNESTAIGFCADRFADGSGYTSTLTSLLGNFLTQIEGICGPRQADWTILGIQFSGHVPHIWFPGGTENRRHVAIVLAMDAKDDPSRAIFQLAHESVHLIAPCCMPRTNVFEEGLATAYQIDVNKNNDLRQHVLEPQYREAAEVLMKLVRAHPQAILALRRVEPYFHKFTIEHLTRTLPGVDQGLAAELCEEFGLTADRAL